jgi:Zn-dependent M28 family amino/carboxypeptidase
MVLVGLPHAGSPLLPAGWPNDDRAQPLRGRRFSAQAEVRFEPVIGYNVVAVVRGRDPALAGTYVAFGAHLDHIGIQPPVNGDSIANGADDDGSGSMSILEIARTWARAPVKPRRTALFVWHTGEEKGLLGSEWFTSHPTVPLDSIVAQLNADMIGRNAPDSLYLVGPRAAPRGQSSVLGAIVDSVNASLPRPFLINREWDSPTHPEQIYYRSDHYNYARRGVPIVFFTTGLHVDYHRVTDEPAKIDYDKLARVDRLLYEVGRAVADRPTRPR